jgi:hypothetical protein
MTLTDLTIFLQIIMFLTGSILMFFAGVQDEKTRNPFLLIPALMAIGLSAGLTTFAIVTLASFIIFFLPAKINKVLGKADLLLFASILVIIILSQNVLLNLIMFESLALTVIIMLLDKKRTKEVPLIHYYSIGYALAILITIAISISVIIGVLL